MALLCACLYCNTLYLLQMYLFDFIPTRVTNALFLNYSHLLLYFLSMGKKWDSIYRERRQFCNIFDCWWFCEMNNFCVFRAYRPTKFIPIWVFECLLVNIFAQFCQKNEYFNFVYFIWFSLKLKQVLTL